MTIPPYQVSAINTSKASENKIHDDATARRFGFKAGFVPGVNVYAYMTHLPVQRWGRAWLERGTSEAKFGKPVYENAIAEVTAVEDAHGMEISVHSEGVLCATGRAALPLDLPPPPALSDFNSVPPRSHRAPADETSLKTGDWLGMNPLTITEVSHTQDLHDFCETDPIYASEKIVHLGSVMRC